MKKADVNDDDDYANDDFEEDAGEALHSKRKMINESKNSKSNKLK